LNSLRGYKNSFWVLRGCPAIINSSTQPVVSGSAQIGGLARLDGLTTLRLGAEEEEHPIPHQEPKAPGYSSKGTFWPLHSKAFPWSSMTNRVKKAKRLLYKLTPQEIASRKTLNKFRHIPHALVELQQAQKQVVLLRQLVIQASQRIEINLPIRKELSILFAAKRYRSMGDGRTMCDYLVSHYAKHCVKVLLQAQSVWSRWIPTESVDIARLAKPAAKGVLYGRSDEPPSKTGLSRAGIKPAGLSSQMFHWELLKTDEGLPSGSCTQSLTECNKSVTVEALDYRP